jgi:hypothetical protein
MNNLEKHVVSLETSKRLNDIFKEVFLIPQFYWTKRNMSDALEISYGYGDGRYSERYPAFMASELMEMIPEAIYDANGNNPIYPYINLGGGVPRYWAKFRNLTEGKGIPSTNSDNLAEALAKMIIYLHESGLQTRHHLNMEDTYFISNLESLINQK